MKRLVAGDFKIGPAGLAVDTKWVTKLLQQQTRAGSSRLAAFESRILPAFQQQARAEE
jgi:hypothetical protein